MLYYNIHCCGLVWHYIILFMYTFSITKPATKKKMCFFVLFLCDKHKNFMAICVHWQTIKVKLNVNYQTYFYISIYIVGIFLWIRKKKKLQTRERCDKTTKIMRSTIVGIVIVIKYHIGCLCNI